MPVRRKVSKHPAHRVTAEAIDAFRRRDYVALHSALHLAPWEVSPLPMEDHPLGVDDGPMPEFMAGTVAAASWAKAQDLRAALEAAG